MSGAVTCVNILKSSINITNDIDYGKSDLGN